MDQKETTLFACCVVCAQVTACAGDTGYALVWLGASTFALVSSWWTDRRPAKKRNIDLTDRDVNLAGLFWNIGWNDAKRGLGRSDWPIDCTAEERSAWLDGWDSYTKENTR